jgi:N4-gp56 family major capsid protein
MADLFTDTGGATISTMIGNYYDHVFLDRLQANLCYDKYGVQKPLPRNEGNTIVWHQLVNPSRGYDLNETDTAGSSAMSTRKVSATIEWKGDLRNITTRVDATAVNPIVKETVESLGYGAALTKDYFIADKIGFASNASAGVADAASATIPSVRSQGFPVFEGESNTAYWPGSGGIATALLNGLFSTVTTIAHVRNAVTHLRRLNAMPYEDGMYRGVIHPEISRQLRGDSNYATWQAYTNRSVMEKGKLSSVEGVMFEESSQAFTVGVKASAWSNSAYTSLANGNLFGTLIIGKGAYGVTKLKGEDAKVKVITGAEKSDPHDLDVLISYKFAMAAKVLNPSCGVILTYFGNVAP